MQYRSVFFTDTAAVTLSFAMQGTRICYTTNGKEPSQYSAQYKAPVIINKNFTAVKAKVFCNGFLPSESSTAVFIKDGLQVKQVKHSAPHQNYTGNGTAVLHDNKGGIPVFSNKNWLGFNSDTVIIDIELEKESTVKKVLVHLLQDYGSWIFLPERIEVYITDAITQSATLVAEKKILAKQGKEQLVCKPLLLDLNKKTITKHLQVKLFTVKQLPAWHPGSGQKSWVFTDEIKIY
jgi:hexosaminidase